MNEDMVDDDRNAAQAHAYALELEAQELEQQSLQAYADLQAEHYEYREYDHAPNH